MKSEELRCDEATLDRGQSLRLPEGRHLPLHKGGEKCCRGEHRSSANVGDGIYNVP